MGHTGNAEGEQRSPDPLSASIRKSCVASLNLCGFTERVAVVCCRTRMKPYTFIAAIDSAVNSWLPGGRVVVQLNPVFVSVHELPARITWSLCWPFFLVDNEVIYAPRRHCPLTLVT